MIESKKFNKHILCTKEELRILEKAWNIDSKTAVVPSKNSDVFVQKTGISLNGWFFGYFESNISLKGLVPDDLCKEVKYQNVE